MRHDRHTDVEHGPSPGEPPPPAPNRPPLPVIDWSAVRATAPRVVDLGNPGPHDPLPQADVVVITWTTAEWQALDHVFVSSDVAMPVDEERAPVGWHWRANAHEIPGTDHLWGYYRMVEIDGPVETAVRVLLWKADAHLAHPPWITGLESMVGLVLDEARPRRLYTIGTAGGTSVDDKLGDTVITNTGTIRLKNEHNTGSGLDGRTVSCSTWFPDLTMNQPLEQHLLIGLSELMTSATLEYALWEAIHDPKHGNPSWSGRFTVADLTNSALVDLDAPRGLDRRDIPLLTTDYYCIAGGDGTDGDERYSAMEMDDAVVGDVAGQQGVGYVFVRNISDPVVPLDTPDGREIPPGLRENWSGQIYRLAGAYTSMNGALLTWGAIASDSG